ncbi:MAG TPA: four helix bundle protein [Terriglobales bacterium]|nr:four helix bundle protein [Terriglobales bacterium]
MLDRGISLKDFKELNVWKKSRVLTASIYECTGKFPAREIYGLTSQMRRCAISIAANIAEGCGRKSDPELARFLKIARGSAFELECHVLVSGDLKFLQESEVADLLKQIHEVQRMLSSFIQTLSKDSFESEVPAKKARAKTAGGGA